MTVMVTLRVTVIMMMDDGDTGVMVMIMSMLGVMVTMMVTTMVTNNDAGSHGDEDRASLVLLDFTVEGIFMWSLCDDHEDIFKAGLASLNEIRYTRWWLDAHLVF